MKKVTLTVIRDDYGLHRLVKQEDGHPGSSECESLSLKRNYNRGSFYRAVASEIMRWHELGYTVTYKDAGSDNTVDETIITMEEARENLMACFPEDDYEKIKFGLREAFKALYYSPEQQRMDVAAFMAYYIKWRNN